MRIGRTVIDWHWHSFQRWLRVTFHLREDYNGQKCEMCDIALQMELSLAYQAERDKPLTDRIAQLEAEKQQLEDENRRLDLALRNHLCPYDLKDWLVCAGGHGEDCSVCAEGDNAQHRHALLTRAEAAESSLASLRKAVREWDSATFPAQAKEAADKLRALVTPQGEK